MYAIRKNMTDLYFCGISSQWPYNMQFHSMSEGYICAFQTKTQAQEYMDFAISHKWIDYSLEVVII